MRNILKIVVIGLMVLFSSCEKDTVEPEGLCSNPPKLSSKKLIFNKKGGTQEVTISEKYRFSLNYNGKEMNLEKDLKTIEGKDFTTFEHVDFTIKTYELKVVVVMSENKAKPRILNISTNSGNCFTGFVVEQEGNE